MSKSQPVSAQDLTKLIDDAQSMGGIGDAAHDIVVANLNTSAAALAACQGATQQDLGTDMATLVYFVIDKSGSMQEVENDVRDSIMEAVHALSESKGAEVITLTVVTFDHNVYVCPANQPVESIKDVPYRAGGQTALYDAIAVALTGAVGYEEQLLATGTTTKVYVVVFSDGADNSSRYANEARVRTVVEDILSKRRENWVLVFIGFKTYEPVDYHAIARGAGFPTVHKIDLTQGEYDRRHAIRQLFNEVSKSIIAVSKGRVDPSVAAQDLFAV